MAAFQPIGERARWQIIYDLLQEVDTGDVLTYEQMGDALDLDPDKDRHAIQMAMRRAAKEHEEVDQRAVESVPNVGYRVVLPPEHLRLARHYQKKSSKSLARGHSKVVHVDLSGLEPEARKAFELVARGFSMQMEFNRRLDVRQRNLENAIEEMQPRIDRSEAEIAELRDRLQRLEKDADQD